MIIVFPMLCSNTIDYSAIPGVAKAMERYILIHKLDDVLTETKKKFKKSRGRIELQESDENVIGENFHLLSEQNGGTRKQPGAGSRMSEEEVEEEMERLRKEREKLDDEKQKMQMDKKLDQLEQKKKEIEQKKNQVQDATTRVSMQMDSLSIEPTYMEVDRLVNGNKVTDLIGIKVIPFMIQSDEKLVNLMNYDKHLKKFDSLIVQFGRTIRRNVYNFYKKAISKLPIAGRFLGKRGSIKGDPKRDVVLAKSSFRDNVFVCVNSLDFEDDFFQSTSDINKLFKLGWGAIISMDDSKKMAYFCVSEFKGICFPINYNYLFSTLGKDHGKVYEDLSDVKKSAGGIFRRKLPKRKVFESVYYKQYMNNPHLKLFSEMEKIILEKGNFEGKKESMNLVRSMKDFLGSIKSGEPNKIKANLDRRKKYKSISEAKRDMSKIPSFKKGYDLAKKELKKSVKFEKINSNRVIELFAIFCGTYAIRDYVSGTMNSMKHTKKFIDNSKNSLDKSIKKVESKTDEKDNDYILGLSCFITLIAMALPIAMYSIYLVTIKYAIVQTIFGGVYVFISAIGAVIFTVLEIIWNLLSAVYDFTIALGWIFGVISTAFGGLKSVTDFVRDMGTGAADLIFSIF